MKKTNRKRYKKENILQHLYDRSVGILCPKPTAIDNLELYVPCLWKKRILETEKHNKIFASQWISNDSVIYGTKCNKLYCLNILKSTSFEIPLIAGIRRENQLNAHYSEPSSNFGIHAIKSNYSETLLATGTENVNSVGIYKMPEFQPVAIIENFHSDAIFDICWLDDSHVATCSRDSKMGIWCINSDVRQSDMLYYNRSFNINHPYDIQKNVIHAYHKPISKMCLDYNLDRFRTMEYLQSTNKLLIATMSNKLLCFDPIRNMEECNDVISFKTTIQEMVAIRRWPMERHSFAVGGQARFVIFDSRKNGEGMNVLTLNQSSGIRSLAFKDYVLSYGTAEGHINFFDLRIKRHLSQGSYPQIGHDETGASYCWPNNYLQLEMEGIYDQSELFGVLSHSQTAIYTHEYDPTGTKLFAAGGPIAACHGGHVACLFE